MIGPRGVSRRVRAAIPLGLLIALGLALVAASPAFSHHSVRVRLVVIGALLIAIGLGTGTWSLGRRPASTDLATLAAEVAKRIASRVETEHKQALRDEKNKRAPLDLTVELIDVPDRVRDAEAPRHITLTGIGDFYPSHVTDGRLVILGPGGSGKTVLLLTLARDMLKAFKDDPARPIPLRVSLANWDAHRIEFDDWLLYELSTITHLPPPSVLPLLEGGHILPLLDGLDEMDAWVGTDDAPEDQRSAAAMTKVRELDGPRPLVLTSRPETYDRIVALGLHLHGGSIGRICELTRHEIFAYVNGNVDLQSRWTPVLEDLANTNSRLAGQLATPWLLTVALSLYERRGRTRQFEQDPAALLKGANRPEELMTQFADAFVAGLARAARAQRALRAIACYLVTNSGNQHTIGGKILASVDFVVHQLWPIAGTRWPRRLSAAIAFVLWAPALGAAAWVLSRTAWSPIWRLLTLLILVLLAAVSVWRSTFDWPHPRKIELSRFQEDFGRLRLFWSVVIGAGLCGLLSLLGGVRFAGGLAVGFVLAFGLGACLAVRDSIRPAPLMSLAAAIVLVPALAAWWLFGSQGLITGVVCGLTVGGITLLAVVPLVLRLTDAPSGYVDNPVFKSFIAYDMQIGAIVGVFAALTSFLVLSVTPAFHVDQAQAAVVAVTAAVAIGFGSISEASRRHLAMVLCAKGTLVLRLDTLLVGAYEAGLLRRTGIAYQFRHLELRDHFARQPG